MQKHSENNSRPHQIIVIVEVPKDVRAHDLVASVEVPEVSDSDDEEVTLCDACITTDCCAKDSNASEH